MSGIYIHIPFCKQACFYCDFHFSTSLKKKDELVLALVKELEMRKNELENEVIESIYFGGGTPSVLSVDELQLLIQTVYKNYTVAENPEITLEANPDDLTSATLSKQTSTLSSDKKKTLGNQIFNDLSVRAQSRTIFEMYKDIGINRLSIGIQSFFDDDLQSMNRAHSAKEAKKCLSAAIGSFDNITIDLIYGIPNMTAQKWRENLQIAFGFGVNHISSYALTVEPKTALATFIKQKKYPALDEALAANHFDILVAETEKNGFVHYEISNFGKPNYFSKHNTSYWLGKKYIGIGPSAHSFHISHRSWNVSNNTQYIKAIQSGTIPNQSEKLTKEDQFNEYIMTGLRTIWGVSLQKIEDDFGSDFKKQLIASAEIFVNQNLVVIEKETKQFEGNEEVNSQDSCNDLKLKTTKKGKFLADGIASKLFIVN